MRKIVRSLTLGILSAALALALPAGAAPITVGFSPVPFDNISLANQTNLNSVATQFSVTIDYVAAPQFILDLYPTYTNMVSFTFANVGSIGSNIHEIYWDWTTTPFSLLDPTLPPPGGFYEDPSGETWLLEAPPHPNGDVNPWKFPGASPDLVAEAGADQNGGGLETNEAPITFYMGLGYDTINSQLVDWATITEALKYGGLRLGLHVGSLANYGGESYRFVSNPYVPPLDPGGGVVPVPAAAGLGMLGMAIVGAMRRMKRAK